MKRVNLKHVALTSAVASIIAFSGSADALQATTTFTASATVVSNCTIAATNLSFGNYDPLSARHRPSAWTTAQTSP
jgi:spore coat protein U-like protein